MKRKWTTFLILNIFELAAFTISLCTELYLSTRPFGNINIPLWGLILIVSMYSIVLYNSLRNTSLSKAIIHNKKDASSNQNVTRLITVLFSLVILLLAYGLFQGYETLIMRLSWYTFFRKIAYLFQAITVINGAYIVYHQGTLSKLVETNSISSINNSIEEIGS